MITVQIIKVTKLPLIFPNDITRFVNIPVRVLAVWVNKIWIVWFFVVRICAAFVAFSFFWGILNGNLVRNTITGCEKKQTDNQRKHPITHNNDYSIKSFFVNLMLFSGVLRHNPYPRKIVFSPMFTILLLNNLFLNISF